MGVRVLKPGLLTTIQDLGRNGYQSQGFGVSGVMDRRSFTIANLLLDNPQDEAVIEFTLIGPTLEFTSETIIAVTGGNFQPMVNKRPIKMYTAIYMNKGDILEFAGCKTGCRGYIAFSSFLNVPLVMGSRSTNIKCGIGGFQGRKLRERDLIIFRQKRRYLPQFLSRSLDINEFQNQEEITLRVVLGPQNDYFTEKGIETFLSGVYTVSKDYDRMGCRLEGPMIESKGGTDIISDGIAFGCIQVPSGKPIILLADRQTTGGYAKIATIASVDIPKLAQQKPGNTVRFTAVTVEEAAKLILDEEREFESFRNEIRKPCAEVLTSRLTAKRLSKLFVRAGD
ncbi:MAG: biotin-dependent carboxyltransferase family protein [Oscillospiraceae bacterium]|nr:biotin-dependent carboxyltransferase family protein [Oscillospiraceae bacterium]